jgi:hypothetical protein
MAQSAVGAERLALCVGHEVALGIGHVVAQHGRERLTWQSITCGSSFRAWELDWPVVAAS